MNRDEILAMVPGKELDKLIAEKVMKWEFLRIGYFGCYDATDHLANETKRQVELRDWLDNVDLHCIGDYYIDVASDFWIDDYSFKPSKDIKAAWEVVENLLENSGIDFEFKIGMDRLCEARLFDDGVEIGFAEATTAPEAICKAALIATLEE